MFIPQAQPHAQSLFLFPIVFGINLIHFFDFFEDKEERYRAAGNSIVCFAASIACQSRHVTVRRMRTVSKSATFLATESVNSAPIKRGKTEVQIFWQGKAQNSSPILRCTFLARRSAKLIANFSATMVTSLPSFSLSLSLCISLSLSPNVPHAQYRKRFRASYNIGSASALPIISWWDHATSISSSSRSVYLRWVSQQTLKVYFKTTYTKAAPRRGGGKKKEREEVKRHWLMKRCAS